jgi:hypothetical protein
MNHFMMTRSHPLFSRADPALEPKWLVAAVIVAPRIL